MITHCEMHIDMYTHNLITCHPLSEPKYKIPIEYSESIIESIWPTSID